MMRGTPSEIPSPQGSSVSTQVIDLARELGVRVIYDLGSRDGLDGLRLLDAIPGDELHVFECNPPAARVCRKNAESYKGSGRVIVNELAVSDHDGSASFFAIDPERTVTPWPDGNIGASSLFKANPRYPSESYCQREIRVTSVRLDTYCEDATSPDMLWADLQGAELAAFRGARLALQNVRLLHVEVAFRPVYISQPLFREVDRFLRRAGFRLVSVTNLGPVGRCLRGPSPLPMGPWFGDAIYVRA